MDDEIKKLEELEDEGTEQTNEQKVEEEAEKEG